MKHELEDVRGTTRALVGASGPRVVLNAGGPVRVLLRVRLGVPLRVPLRIPLGDLVRAL